MRYRERCALCAVWLQAQCTREGPGVMCGRKCVVPWWRWALLLGRARGQR